MNKSELSENGNGLNRDPDIASLGFSPEFPEIQRSWDNILVAIQYLPPTARNTIKSAFLGASSYHNKPKKKGGNLRASGEHYVTHPAEVCAILAEYKVDETTLISSLLHDTKEDTHIPEHYIRDNYGPVIDDTVDAVTSVSGLEYTKEENTAASLVKIHQALIDNLRAVLVKGADRLHNMRTIGYLRYPAQVKNAHETLEYLSPIMHHINAPFANELDYLSYRVLYPEEAQKAWLLHLREGGRLQQNPTLLKTLEFLSKYMPEVSESRISVPNYMDFLSESDGDVKATLPRDITCTFVVAGDTIGSTLSDLQNIYPTPIQVSADTAEYDRATVPYHTPDGHYVLRLDLITKQRSDVEAVSAVDVFAAAENTDGSAELMNEKLEPTRTLLERYMTKDIEPVDLIRYCTADIKAAPIKVSIYEEEGFVSQTVRQSITVADVAALHNSAMLPYCRGAIVNGAFTSLTTVIGANDTIQFITEQGSLRSRHLSVGVLHGVQLPYTKQIVQGELAAFLSARADTPDALRRIEHERMAVQNVGLEYLQSALAHTTPWTIEFRRAWEARYAQESRFQSFESFLQYIGLHTDPENDSIISGFLKHTSTYYDALPVLPDLIVPDQPGSLSQIAAILKNHAIDIVDWRRIPDVLGLKRGETVIRFLVEAEDHEAYARAVGVVNKQFKTHPH